MTKTSKVSYVEGVPEAKITLDVHGVREKLAGHHFLVVVFNGKEAVTVHSASALETLRELLGCAQQDIEKNGE